MHRIWVLLAFCVATSAPAAAKSLYTIDVDVEPLSGALAGRWWLSILAGFGPDRVDTERFSNITLVAAHPADACATLDPILPGSLVLVWRGNCSFSEKALSVLAAGGAGMLAGNYEGADRFRMSANMSIDLLSVLTDFDGATALLPHTPLRVKLAQVVRSNLDPAALVLFCMAVALVFAGAWLSSAKERRSRDVLAGALLPPLDEPDIAAYLSTKAAISFVFVASAALLLLYAFTSTLMYVLVVLFALAGAQALQHLLTPPLRRALARCKCTPPPLLHTHSCTVPYVGPVCLLDCLVGATTCAFAVWWAVERKSDYAWALQDILGCAVLLLVQKAVRLPDIRVSAILLTLAFVYDVFWVFFAPLLFHESPMVAVGTSGVPMVLQIPRFLEPARHRSYAILGLGDIALPGLFISFLLRFDYHKNSRGMQAFFPVAMVGYTGGLLVAMLVSVLSLKGQPALFYIVPATLGVIVPLAWWRGQLRELWAGPPRETPSAQYANVQSSVLEDSAGL